MTLHDAWLVVLHIQRFALDPLWPVRGMLVVHLALSQTALYEQRGHVSV